MASVSIQTTEAEAKTKRLGRLRTFTQPRSEMIK